jgi:hypothetical protein
MKKILLILLCLPFFLSATISDDLLMMMSCNKKSIQNEIEETDLEDYEDALQKHLREGKACLEKAKKICVLLPNISDREMGNNCLVLLFSAINNASPFYKIIGFVSLIAYQYTAACINEWHQLQTALQEAEYHYTLCDFYKKVLIQELEKKGEQVPDWYYLNELY